MAGCGDSPPDVDTGAYAALLALVEQTVAEAAKDRDIREVVVSVKLAGILDG
jgi:hypothetical protein